MKQPIAAYGRINVFYYAAKALIEYVNTFAPEDYSRTVYYLDFDLQIDIQVNDGKVTIRQSQISEERAKELADEWYK